MKEELTKHGALVDVVYYCLHNHDDGCDCRKPKTVLFHRAASELNIDFTGSYVISDLPMDIEAGKALGCKTVQVTTGSQSPASNLQSLKLEPAAPYYVAHSLIKTVNWIVKKQNLKHRTMKTVSVIIPALNEKEGIVRTIESIPKAEFERMGYEVQILVVDNGSTDGTGELARKAKAEVVFEPRQGYGRAYKAGFVHAKGDIIATVDADLTHPVEDILRLVKILEEDSLDFLTTNRFALIEKEAMSFQHKLGNTVLNLATKLLFGLNLKDSQSGMWVFKRSLLSEAILRSNSMSLSEELKIEACYFCRCRWKEVPIRYSARVVGKAKLKTWKHGFGNLLYLVKKRISR